MARDSSRNDLPNFRKTDTLYKSSFGWHNYETETQHRFLPPSHRSWGIKGLELEKPPMNNQYQHVGKPLTPSIAEELIRELFTGKTAQRQEIIKTVDEVHRERGGEPTRSDYDPVGPTLSSMKEAGHAENPKQGLWHILSEGVSETETSEETSQSEESDPIKTLDGFMAWAKKFDSGAFVFRGVTNAAYGIQASAYRRPEEEERSFEKFLYINRDLIREARLRGYDQKEGRELKPLEILADLQHFQAATYLIDFTHSAQIALFFACQPTSKEPLNGKVFAVRNQSSRFKEITPDLLTEDVDKFLTDDKEAQLYYWQPRHQNHRIIAQQSIFLFGNYEFDPDDECVIAGDKKEDILKELQNVSGITEDRLFPDFEGFARVRGVEALYTELTPSDYRTRGRLAYEREDYKDAIADYNIVIDKNPNDPEAYYLRGLAQKSLKEPKEAIVDFDHVLRLDSGHKDAYFERGGAKYNLERYEEAIVDFDHVLRLDSEYKDAYYGRGGAKYNLERYEEAIVDFDHVLRLDSEYKDAYYWRGRAKYNLKRYEEAIVDFDEAIHTNFEGARVHYWLGISKKRLGQYTAAIADFDRAIRLEPTYAYSHYHRGGAKFELERFAEAEVDLKEALSLAKQTDNDAMIGWILDILKKITRGDT